MKQMYSRLFSFCCIIAAASFSGCIEDSTIGSPEYAGRGAMLSHYADNLIMPAYDRLHNESVALSEHLNKLDGQSTEADLETARNQWQKTFEVWQEAALYDFGPAAAEGVRQELTVEVATFPTNASEIEAFIQQNDTAFNNFNRDTRGFLAIEYLLYGTDWSQALGQIQNDPKRQAYLRSLGRHLIENIGRVKNDWKSYRANFVANESVSAGSPTSDMYNAFVKGYEILKNYKLGLPIGAVLGSTPDIDPDPTQVEAYYSQQSLHFVKAQLDAVWRVYTGTTANQTPNPDDGIGWDHYVASTTGGSDLLNQTTDQWQKVETAIANLPDKSLQELITENPAQIEAAYTEAQAQTRYFKNEMTSRLGLQITFSDNDGD